MDFAGLNMAKKKEAFTVPLLCRNLMGQAYETLWKYASRYTLQRTLALVRWLQEKDK